MSFDNEPENSAFMWINKQFFFLYLASWKNKNGLSLYRISIIIYMYCVIIM